jgi:hypothetical protein
MKSLFYTIIILGGAFLAYDYYGAPPGKKLVFKSLNPPVKHQASPVKPLEAEKPVVEQTAPAPVRAVMEPTKPVAPAPAPKPAATAAAPKFAPIEDLTSNWMKIPVSAFPREVKLVKDAEFKMSMGTSKIAAGGKAIALSAANGVLTLAPTANSPARALQPIDGTDLKAQLNASYERWKVARAEELKAIAAKKAAQAPAVQAGPSSSEVGSEGKPLRDATSAYPLLVASMKSGQITEIKPENITNWQDAQPTVIQGKPGWAIKVSCNVKTVFGMQPTEAQALVLNGKVTGWYYTGSGEEVP